MIPDRHSTYTISITAFDEKGSFDESAMRAHFDRLAAAGMGAYIGGSAPGQGNALTLDEMARLFEIGRECFEGKASVRAMGVEPRTAEQLIAIARLARQAGLDAMQVYSLDMGHAASPSPVELERYFRTMFEAVEIPAVLSTHQCMGWFMPHEMMARLLADYPHVRGIHVTNPDVGYVAGVIRVAQEAEQEVEVHTGLQVQAISALTLGATGFLSGEGNLFPELCVSLIDRFDAGDFQGVIEAHRKLLTIFPMNFYGQGLRGLKAGMKLLGQPGHHHRAPVEPLLPHEEEEVATLFRRAGLLPG